MLDLYVVFQDKFLFPSETSEAANVFSLLLPFRDKKRALCLSMLLWPLSSLAEIRASHSTWPSNKHTDPEAAYLSQYALCSYVACSRERKAVLSAQPPLSVLICIESIFAVLQKGKGIFFPGSWY
jgi:hypothetical protein